MNVNLNQPLSEAELDELTDFLDSGSVPDDAMDICMLHGYLTAIAIGPVTVMPSQWYPRIWGQAGGPAFDSLEHARHFLELITRYYNQTVHTFMETPELFLPFLFEYEEDGKWTISAEDWCVGFSLGVGLQSDAWEPLLEDEEFQGVLAPIAAFSLDEAWHEVSEGRNAAKVRERLIALLPEAVQTIHAYWLPTRLKRASGLIPHSFRLGGRSKTRPNAPCPCGSGKKFKKCCGGPRREA